MNPDPLLVEEIFLREKLKKTPSDWETRQQLAHALYDRNAFNDAADVIWMADAIPSTDIDLAFAARILSKAQPRRAIRLLAAVLELNRGKAVQNMGMANALLHHGMVLQAARFYGAALEADPTLVNPDLEHFILWTDDEMRLWADFKDRRPKLGELPWMARDPMEAFRLTTRVTFHTTPISVPSLPAVPGEDLQNDMYQQELARNGKITPPPAVTIPIDRVDPKHRRYDARYGATVVGSETAEPEAVVAEVSGPKMLLTGSAVPTTAATSSPATSPMPPILAAPAPVPMAIPVPDHVTPVGVPVASAIPTVAISPPPPRSPASLAGQSVTQAPAPTRRLITPGGKPNTTPPAAPTGLKPPKAE